MWHHTVLLTADIDRVSLPRTPYPGRVGWTNAEECLQVRQHCRPEPHDAVWAEMQIVSHPDLYPLGIRSVRSISGRQPCCELPIQQDGVPSRDHHHLSWHLSFDDSDR